MQKQPIYVYDIRKYCLIVLMVGLIGSVVWTTILIIYFHSFYTPGAGAAVNKWGFVVALFTYGLAIAGGIAYLRSVKLEVYTDSIRIFVGKKAPREVQYSMLEIGPLRLYGYHSSTFRLTIRGEKESSWDIENEKIRGQNLRLYEWLMERVG